MCFPPRDNNPGKVVGAYSHTPLRARIAKLSPLKGAYLLQTTPKMLAINLGSLSKNSLTKEKKFVIN